MHTHSQYHTHRARSHYYLKLEVGKPPKAPKRESPVLFTKKLQQHILQYPQKVRGSLEW